eukprot:8019529-Alexandrium_andersonii.AAC.1
MVLYVYGMPCCSHLCLLHAGARPALASCVWSVATSAATCCGVCAESVQCSLSRASCDRVRNAYMFASTRQHRARSLSSMTSA